MPTYRRQTDTYYVQRTLDGIGRVYRSLKTGSKKIARRREQALIDAFEQGYIGVVEAFDEGELSITRIRDAHRRGTLAALDREVRRNDETLANAADAALDDKSPDVKESTLNRYRTGLDHFERIVGAQTSVREALVDHEIQAFKRARLDEGAAKETVNNDLGAVSILATYAQRRGWIDDRPEIKKYSSTVRISYLASKEIPTYMAELRPAFRPLFQLLIGTGLRLGEAEHLTVNDLSLGEGTARIRDAKSDAGIRTVFVPSWVIATLRDHLDRHGRGGTDRAFQIPRRTVQKEHNSARKALGKPDYTIHDHRHTAAVYLARAGMPLHLLQQQLGHSTIDQTMRYARFHPEYGDVSEYFEAVGRELGLAEGEPVT